MKRVEVAIAGVSTHLVCSALDLHDALGTAWSASLEVVADETVETRAMLGAGAALLVEGPHDARVLRGLVAEVRAVGTAQRAPARRYRLVLRSALHRLDLARRTRVFQELSAPEIVLRVLAVAGIDPGRVRIALRAVHAPRRYVVQYAELDAAFVRRLCEEGGFWLRSEAGDDDDSEGERFVLEDTSSAGEVAPASPVALLEGDGLQAPRPSACFPEMRRRHRPGTVTVRDHDPARPALRLEARAAAGAAFEQRTEIYRGAARFRTDAEGDARARVGLERARGDASTLRFRSTALSVAAGMAVTLENLSGGEALETFAGAWFVTDARLSWRSTETRVALEVEAMPLDRAWRPAARTPRPRIPGVHSAIVTGPAGSEIHADANGCVRVRFHWDREGPVDESSSLPVRVLQPNMPGSMLLPRVGWEVLVAFEDGDPDRPFIVGRLNNAKAPPPFGLPANKTITSLATASSPGGACQNSVHFDDAAGRQHMAWNAGFGKTTTVGNDMATQTVGNEVCSIGGSETVTIGANDKLSVTEPYVVDIAGAQSGSVGGSQSLVVHGDMGITTGAESVQIGAALLEQIGSPADGLKGLAVSAGMDLLGSVRNVGPYLSAAAGVGMAAVQGYQQGGWGGAADAAAYGTAKAALSLTVGRIPGADAVMAAAEGTGQAPWTPPQNVGASKKAEGGGAAGPSAGADAGSGGAGQRVTKVGGAMSQLIGAVHLQATPGNVKATVLGPSTRIVGGDHNVRAVRVSVRTQGASVDSAASLKISAAAEAVLSASAAHSIIVGGKASVSSGGGILVKAGGALDVNVGGALSLKGGGVVLKCGDSSVTIASGGVVLKASKVTIDGKVIDGGKGTTA